MTCRFLSLPVCVVFAYHILVKWVRASVVNGIECIIHLWSAAFFLVSLLILIKLLLRYLLKLNIVTFLMKFGWRNSDIASQIPLLLIPLYIPWYALPNLCRYCIVPCKC